MLEEPVVYHQPENPQFHQPHTLPTTYAHDFQPPTSQTTPTYQGILATRSQRLLAKFVDATFLVALMGMTLAGFLLLPLIISTDLTFLIMIFGVFFFPILMLPILLGWLAINCYFLYTRGQSPGKMLLKIKIVRDTDHTNIPGMEIVLIRTLVPVVINMFIPLIFDIVDACFIFNDDHRCLHDIMANTTVIQA